MDRTLFRLKTSSKQHPEGATRRNLWTWRGTFGVARIPKFPKRHGSEVLVQNWALLWLLAWSQRLAWWRQTKPADFGFGLEVKGLGPYLRLQARPPSDRNRMRPDMAWLSCFCLPRPSSRRIQCTGLRLCNQSASALSSSNERFLDFLA